MRMPAYAGSSPVAFANLLGLPAASNTAARPNAAKAAILARRKAEDDRRKAEDEKRRDEDAKRAEEDGVMEPGDAPDLGGEGDNPDCPECDGTGEVDGETCPLCGGDGEVHSPDQPDDKTDDVGPDDTAKTGKKKGQRAERKRWVSVLGHKAVSRDNIGAAAAMLANSDMAPEAVIATLTSMPAAPAASTGLRGRMAATRIPNPGADAPEPGKKFATQAEADAAAIVEAGKLRRGEK